MEANCDGRDWQLTQARPTIEERFPRLSAADLFEAGQRQPDWLVGGVLIANQPMVICGTEKSLKTSIAIDLGLSLVSREPFLGRFNVCRPVNVGIFSGESGATTLGETATSIAVAKGFHLPDYASGFGIFTTLPTLTKDDDLDAVRCIIERDALGVVVIDPAYLAMDLEGREGSMFAVGAQLSRITRLCRELSVTPIILHHTASTDEARGWRPPRLQDMAFAGWKQWCRQYLMLSCRRPWEPETGSHWLWCLWGGAGYGDTIALDVVEGRRSDTGGRRWDVRITTVDDAKSAAAANEETKRGERRGRAAEVKMRDDAAKIMAAIASIGKPAFKAEIKPRSKIGGDRFEAAFAWLIDTKQVHQWPDERAANKQWHPRFFSEPAMTEMTPRASRKTKNSPENHDDNGHNGTAGLERD